MFEVARISSTPGSEQSCRFGSDVYSGALMVLGSAVVLVRKFFRRYNRVNVNHLDDQNWNDLFFIT